MASREMQRFLDRNAAGQDKGKDLSIEDQRRNFDAFMAGLQLPENILVDDYTLAGRPARKYFTSGVREDASLLYFHGGGHLSGSLDSHHSFAAHLAIACGTAVNALDYRLAPEHPYPAAVDDAVTAYSEMLEYTPSENIMLAGDSAGGNLALACFLRIKSAVCHFFSATKKFIPLFIGQQIRLAQLLSKQIMLTQYLQQFCIADCFIKVSATANHSMITE